MYITASNIYEGYMGRDISPFLLYFVSHVQGGLATFLSVLSNKMSHFSLISLKMLINTEIPVSINKGKQGLLNIIPFPLGSQSELGLHMCAICFLEVGGDS